MLNVNHILWYFPLLLISLFYFAGLKSLTKLFSSLCPPSPYTRWPAVLVRKPRQQVAASENQHLQPTDFRNDAPYRCCWNTWLGLHRRHRCWRLTVPQLWFPGHCYRLQREVRKMWRQAVGSSHFGTSRGRLYIWTWPLSLEQLCSGRYALVFARGKDWQHGDWA